MQGRGAELAIRFALPRQPHDVWAGYFPDEPAEGATAEDAEPHAVGPPARKDLPV